MTEKKGFDCPCCRSVSPERILNSQGWVKAEPTDCLKCKDWYDGECHHFNHAIEGINSEIDDINNEICLDFKPKQGDKK
jgi:hypothetical protein